MGLWRVAKRQCERDGTPADLEGVRTKYYDLRKKLAKNGEDEDYIAGVSEDPNTASRINDWRRYEAEEEPDPAVIEVVTEVPSSVGKVAVVGSEVEPIEQEVAS